MDAFSEILSWVKPNGALFFNADFFAPRGFTAPPRRRLLRRWLRRAQSGTYNPGPRKWRDGSIPSPGTRLMRSSGGVQRLANSLQALAENL
jgi:hypothetical protein